MSSIWCPKCQYNKKKEQKCPKCGHIEEDHYKEQKTISNKKYMTKCKVCDNNIAVKATSCPHCGDIKSKNLFWKIIKILAIVIITIVIIDIILASIGIIILGSSIETINKQSNKIISEIKIPKFEFKEPEYQKQERERKNKIRKKEIEKQNIINYHKMQKKNAKENLKKQMSF